MRIASKINSSGLDQIETSSQCKLVTRRAGFIRSSASTLCHHRSHWSCEIKRRENDSYLLSGPVLLANIHLLLLEALDDRLDGRLLLLQLLHLQALATTHGEPLQAIEMLVGELQILYPELLVDDVEIADRVDVTLDVDNLGIVEAANDLEDGIDGANVRQEGVSETGTGGGTAGQTGDIIDSQVGRHLGLGLVLLAEPVVTLIGNNDTSLEESARRVEGSQWGVLTSSGSIVAYGKF